MSRLIVTVQWHMQGMQDQIVPLAQTTAPVERRDRLFSRLPVLTDYALLRVAKGLSSVDVDYLARQTGYSVSTVCDLVLVGNKEGLKL